MATERRFNLYSGACAICGDRVLARRGTLVHVEGETRRKPAHHACAERTGRAEAPMPPATVGERFYLYSWSAEGWTPFNAGRPWFDAFTDASDAAVNALDGVSAVVIARHDPSEPTAAPCLYVQASDAGPVFSDPRKVGVAS